MRNILAPYCKFLSAAKTVKAIFLFIAILFIPCNPTELRNSIIKANGGKSTGIKTGCKKSSSY